MTKKLRELILFFLAETGMPQRRLALSCGITQPALWYFLNEKHGLKLTSYEKIISYLKANSDGIEYPEELKELLA